MRDPRSLLTDEMEAAVGTAFRFLTSYPVTTCEIRRWAIAVYHPAVPPRRFWDEDHATALGGMLAPEDFNPFAWATADPPVGSGINAVRPWPEPELGLPEPRTRANILSGLDVEHTGVGIRPGDVVRSTTRLESYREQEGRQGLMLFTTLEEEWVNQDDRLVRTSRSTVIRYR